MHYWSFLGFDFRWVWQLEKSFQSGLSVINNESYFFNVTMVDQNHATSIIDVLESIIM